ncbi:MAG: hypothetical protein DRM99_04590 [Thermoplasmata archaeon]|nr:MAG: hypothetical protein DRM99_04590 [Thermoplasmata archaeon]
MGKNEEESAEQTADEKNSTSDKEKNNDEVTETDKNEEKNTEKAEENTNADKKSDTDELRKVIKVGNNEENKQTEKTPEQNIPENTEETPNRETLEQKRAILQSIKDFDFQIKKNQEEIAALNKKLDSVSKDLDDLVSLYEIVSEQMNPFVGLSKVTKKRIEALENFTKEIEDLKTRLGDLEAFAEQAGANLQNLRMQRENESIETQKTSAATASIQKNELSDDDFDVIIERSLKALTLEQQIDTAIDEFIENLKM